MDAYGWSIHASYWRVLCGLLVLSLLAWKSHGEWALASLQDTSVTYVSGVWLDATTSLLVGGTFDKGVIAKSVDVGVTFSNVLSVNDEIYDIAYGNDSSTTYAIAVTEGGGVYISTNEGDSWSLTTTLPAALFGTTFGNNSMAYVCGVSSSLKAAVFRANASTAFTVWDDVSFNATVQLTAIGSQNGVDVIAVGDRGAIYTSSDMGNSWTLQSSSTTAFLYDVVVSPTSALHAMASGDRATILSTTDGGSTWISRQSAVTAVSGVSVADSFIFHAIDLLDTDTAYAAVSNGYIIKTTDGGATWEPDDGFVASENVASLFSIAMHSMDIGVAGAIAGTGAFVRVANPTSQPTGQPTTEPTSLTPTSVPTSDPTGSDVTGAQWTAYTTSSTANAFLGAAWTSTSTVVLVGQQLIRGVIAVSTDFGATFDMTFVSYQLEDVAVFTQASTVYVVAVSNAGYVYTSSDEGDTFVRVFIDDVPFYGITIGTNGDAYICGGEAGVYTASVSDGFATWTRLIPSVGGLVTLNAIASFDGIRAIAVGSGGQVLVTEDAGITWENISTDVTSALNGISCASDMICIIVGSDAVILRTGDGGKTFESLQDNVIGVGSIDISTNFENHVISMVSTAVAYLAASNGAIIKTLNSGGNWEVDTLDAFGAQLLSLSMSTTALGVAGDTTGNVYVKNIPPTAQPTVQPSGVPTGQPSAAPSAPPTTTPTQPSGAPTGQPSSQPSSQPSTQPSRKPTAQPVLLPTSIPTKQPTGVPTGRPSGVPSMQPSAQPTGQPSSQPTTQPSSQPTLLPSRYPTGQPSSQPTSQPSSQPVSPPTGSPTSVPTAMPTTVTRTELMLMTTQTLQNISTSTFSSSVTYTDAFVDAVSMVVREMPSLDRASIACVSCISRRLTHSKPTIEGTFVITNRLRGLQRSSTTADKTDVTFTVAFILEDTDFSSASDAVDGLNEYWAASISAGNLTMALRMTSNLYENVSADIWDDVFTIISTDVVRAPPTSVPTSMPTRVESGGSSVSDAVIIGAVLGVTLPILICAGVVIYLNDGDPTCSDYFSSYQYTQHKEYLSDKCSCFLALFSACESNTEARKQPDKYRKQKAKARSSFDSSEDSDDSDYSSGSSGSERSDESGRSYSSSESSTDRNRQRQKKGAGGRRGRKRDGDDEDEEDEIKENASYSGSSSEDASESDSDDSNDRSISDDDDSYVQETRAAQKLKRQKHSI